MKKVWLGLGTIVIIILLLLQTRFTEFLRLDYDGYAVEAGKLKQLLVMDPTEEDFVSEDVPFHEYKALDFVYQRGNSFYLGEKKKTQIDMDFPMLINDGAGIMFTDNESTLFDVEFEQAETYRGLMMSDKTAYNPDGERADANEYLFARLGNGFYSNLALLSLEEYGEMQEITPNSFICFREDYFTCYEPVNGIGVYKAYVNMAEDDSIFVDGEEYTYRELLLLLEALTDRTKDEKEDTLEEEIPTLTEEEESLMEDESAPEEPEEESSEDESVEEPAQKEKPVKEKKPSPAKQPSAAKKPSSSSPSSPSRPSRPSGSKPGNKQEGSMGVRPDSARPDKNKGDKEEEKVEDYIKPEVTVNSMEAGIYRVLIDTQVEDPASRLHKLRKVQFEFYELADENDTTGTLVYRTYTASTKVVEAGSGSLKPGTRYRVNAYYTYYDEYNNVVVENIILPDDGIVTTGSHSELGEIVLFKGIQNTEDANPIDYMAIPIYYDNKLVITNVAYDAAASDPEAIYAIDNAAGITIHVEGQNGSTFAMDCRIDKVEQSKFKNGTLTSFTTTGLLNPNTEYTYEIIAKAFDGYELTITEPNNRGEFRTCKSRPVGDISVAANKVADIKLDVVMTDPDDSAVKNPTSGEYEIYLVAATDKYNQPGGFTWDDCKAYLDKGNRVAEDAMVHFVHRFAPEDISVGNDGTIRISETVTANSLDLNTGYHVYLLCDFDLQNQAGVQEHEEVAYLKFTSASLSSLGNIYVYSDITDIAAHSANIWFELNENKTNEELVKLISSAVFNINDTENKTTDAVLDVADGGGIGAFTGYITNAQGEIEETTKSKIVFPSTMFVDDKYLKSMTEYEIEPVIKAIYNGKEYDMNVVLTKSKFKTLREPATITVENDLFAAGTLSFKVTVNDPDDAVCGNSGHMVVLNLYDYNRNFVRSVRIPKNTPVDQKFTGLDPAKQYFIDFIAVEYNEGYTNATYESNKVLYTHYFDSALDITGTIKLQNIKATMEAGKMTANTLVTIHDPVRVMNNEIPYLIRLEKDGVAESPEAFNSYTYDADNTIREEHAYKVDKGEHTYTLTLYIYYNNNELILDTLTFTTEDVVEGIANAQEFVKVMKESNGKGRYVITGDIDLGTTGTKYTVNGATVYPYGLVSNFNGQIDFQGYTLSLNKTSNVAGIFNNIGPKGEIFNAVFDFKADTSSRIYGNGMLCNINYGHIHDVIANFKGGSNVTNEQFGMLCYMNATTGIIERFVVKNDPEEGKFPFVARYMCGLVTGRNYGIVRDGYAYGEDIYAATNNTANDLYIGGIVGINYNVAELENVFSLVNVMVSPAQSESKKNKYYGSVAGSGNGTVTNVYGIGQSTYTVPDYAGNTFDKAMVGSVTGAESAKCTNLFYWNEAGFEYTASKYQSLANLESLHDYNWQQEVLGDAFDVQPVEVGFYPQVILNGELPQQEYIPLPQRADANLAIMSANVLSYAEDGNSAEVEFRLSNTKNVWVDAITIDGLTVTLHTDSVVSADGFTTIKATVSEPTKYLSNYEIVSAQYKDGNRNKTVTFDPKPILMVDFYRDIDNPDEWYEYVVMKPNENARLAKDIDFAGVPYSRIQCTKNYYGKLSGGKNGDNSYGYTLRNISIPNRYEGYVFSYLYGEIKDLCIENLNIGATRTSANDSTGFISVSYGTIQNVHLKDVTLYGDDRVGALVACSLNNSVVKDCSATNVDITYREYGSAQTTAYVGGLVGRLTSARLENCYVRGVNILASDLRNASGIGGVVGSADESVIDSVYATGDIESRVSRVGGIVGNYTFGYGGATIKNMIARVNVKGYQDIIGGLIGALNLSQKPLTAKNNITGVAFGNVSCSNTDAVEVSYTTGWIVGNTGSLYGADFQLFNGILGTEKDKNTLDLISYEQATNPSVYTDENLLDMENCYEFDWVEDGYMPALYYSDGSGHLPFQAKDEPISLTKLSNNLIDITAIGVNKENGYIWMDVEGPAGYKITGITIEDLLTRDFSYNEQNREDLTIPANGQARINVYYLEEVQQKHFLDSYNLVELKYISADGTEAGQTDYSKAPVRVPLTLYMDIWDLEDWQEAFAGNDRNAGNYENYRIRADISFATTINYAKNLKIGRLVGDVSGPQGGRANLTNITITDSSTNLIYRLNSELANLNFINCTVQTKGRDNVGLIGTSAASTHDVTFENITIAEVKGGGGRKYMGIIAYQDTGSVGYSDPADTDKGKVVLKNVSVGADVTNNTYVGGLSGYAQGGATFKNIYAEGVQVYGKQYVGGILGQTGTIYMDGVEAKNVHVTACSSTAGYVGGIIGHVNAGYVNSSGAHFVNIKLTGTPEYDDKGNIVDSTTVIAVDPGAANASANYVGGLFGWNVVRECGFVGTSTEKESLFAEGIVVKGYADYVGGIAGRGTVQNAVIKDSLITVSKAPDTVKKYMGGVVGYSNTPCKYNKTIRCEVRPVNFASAGLVTGHQVSNSTSYMQAEDSILKAETVGLSDTQKAELQYYGGLIGYSEPAISYGTVYNCTVDAGEGSLVGGLAGYELNGVIRSFYYAEPASENSPTAKEQYYVKGKNLVGGLAGQNDYTSNNTQYSYSNANVIADGEYAGGLFGAYENGYSAVMLNGSMRYTYADCTMKYNYFAGTVTAGNYAGGLIGRLGMTTVENEDHAKLGGRSIEAQTGSNNEKEYTQHNLMLAEYIKATKSGGEAYAVAGNFDGFEGKANYDYNGSVPDLLDKTGLDKAVWTHLYAGTKVNGVRLYDMTNVDAPTHAKNSGTWRYKAFGDFAALYPNDANLNDSGFANRANVRLLLPDDLEYIYTKDSNGKIVPGGYKGIKWVAWSAAAGNRDSRDMRGDIYRLITKDVNYDSANMGSAVGADGLTDRQFYEGKAYLPHVRINTADKPISDWLTKYQSDKRVALPVPQTGGEFEDRVFNVNGRSLSLRAPRTQTYGILYQSDVDKINLEFSEDLLSGGYFILYKGDEIVDSQLIYKRVYTYNYDFKDNLKLCYGYADTDTFIEIWEEEGKVYGEDFVLHDIFTTHGSSDAYLMELEAVDYKSRSLEHHVMTYGDKYYYIDDDGVWSGTGSSVSAEEEESREDASATLMQGDFITLYNGMALKTNGDVISMTTGEVVRNVSGITPYAKDEKLLAMPLQSFVPADTEGITVESYTRFAEIISGAEIFAREEQMVRSAFDGSEAIIRSALTNVKDSVVLYNKDGSDYCTILGTDGIMIDMYNGDEMNAPEDFRFSGIVYMTNNMYTTAPFIVVEYQNGGMAGYNFMTGEYLFDHTVSNEMSLLDYVKVYFEGDKSELDGISATYASNAKLAEIAGSSERLLSMISGNNENSTDTENNTKENTLKGENPEFAAKAKDGELASNLANKDELPEYVPGADKGKYEDIEKDAGGTGDNDSPEADGLWMLPDANDNLNTTGTEGDTDRDGEEDDLLTDSPITDADDSTDIDSESDKGGDGASMSAGDIAGNGDGAEGDAEDKGADLDAEGSDADAEGEGAEGEAEVDGEGEDADADGEADGEGADADGEGAEADADGEGEDADAEGEAEDGEGTEGENGEGNAGEDGKTDEGKDDLLKGDELLETPEETTDETNGSNKTVDGLKEETTIVSTAGTEVTSTTVSNIKNKDVPKISSDEKTSSNSSSTGNVNSSNKDLVTVYNMETGTYEIIDKTQYFTNKNYYSENVNLNIKNLSSVYNGFAEKEPEKKQANGLGLYIFVTLCALGGIGGTLWYRKKHRMRF